MSRLFGPPYASQPHLSENVLTRLIDGELSLTGRWLAGRHLARCARCRARYERLARVELKIAERRKRAIEGLGPLSSTRRDLFIQQLDLLLESVPAKSQWRRSLESFGVRPLGNWTPSFKSTATLVCAGLIVFAVSRWQLPSVSAADLLNRAVVSDQRPVGISGSGLICRRFRITAARKTINRAVYRDISGLRQPKYAKVASEEADLAARLALAGVNWDDPLSAISFKNWHDRQAGSTDEVRSSGRGFLTISTHLTSTNIARESLTVREDTFHPTDRVIEYRDFGIVDISEVSIESLRPEAADSIFLDREISAGLLARPVPAAALLPSAAQLNEAELQARLMLNQVGADTGEQIEIERDFKGVRVQGLVESKERKRELDDSLRDVPLLSIEIRSFDELKSVTSLAAPVVPTQQRSTVAHVSPLDEFFVKNNRGRDDLSRISAGLFNASVAINRSCRSLRQLLLRFSTDDNLSSAAIHARDELLSRMVERLVKDLREQEQLLEEAEMTSGLDAIVAEHPDAAGPDLVLLAERNAALTRELVSGATDSDRSATLIAAELGRTISQLRTLTLTLTSNRSTK
jgi:hypothetical protein